MMEFSSLNRSSYRWIGLIISLTGVAIFAMLKLLDFNYIENWEQKIFIINHYIIILGFVMLSYSQEKTEDERKQNIRFRLLRFSYLLTILGLIAYAAITILDRVEFNLFVVFYIIEAALILYQLLFRLFLRTNPAWIFREKPSKNAKSIIPVVCLIFLIGWLIYAIIEFKI
jgi:L-asparagine transporter-like permease